MIKEFVTAWDSRKSEVENWIKSQNPRDISYESLVKQVVTIMADEDNEYRYDAPDPDRIHTIDDGHYQGTLVFVIAEGGYQPHNYFYVRVGYGSCSGCDTLQAIEAMGSWEDDTPNERQVQDYMNEALHIVQGLKKMGEDA